MQTRKEPVKNRIIKAALDEFLVMGYANSSMRSIASQAETTVGNIYSYFSGKDELFESIVKDTVEELLQLLDIEFDAREEPSRESLMDMAKDVSDVFFRNRIQFLILMDGSEGSKYQDIKKRMISQACDRIVSDSGLGEKYTKNHMDYLLAESIAVSLVEGLIHLFKHTGRNKKKLEKLLGDFLAVIIKGFY